MTQDGCCRTKGHHFFKAVGNIKHSTALGSQAPQHDEKLVGFLGRQHRCRFIHDQQFGILQKTPQNFDALAFTHRKITHRCVRINWQAIIR